MTKKQIFEKLEEILSEGKEKEARDAVENLLQLMCNFFSAHEMENFLNHVREEYGLR
jgi:hypothetical protein